MYARIGWPIDSCQLFDARRPIFAAGARAHGLGIESIPPRKLCAQSSPGSGRSGGREATSTHHHHHLPHLSSQQSIHLSIELAGCSSSPPSRVELRSLHVLPKLFIHKLETQRAAREMIIRTRAHIQKTKTLSHIHFLELPALFFSLFFELYFHSD